METVNVLLTFTEASPADFEMRADCDERLSGSIGSQSGKLAAGEEQTVEGVLVIVLG